MGEHGDAEYVDQRDDGDHRDRGQRQPEVAKQIAGDGKRHISLPAGRALEVRGEGGASSGRSARHSIDIRSTESSSAPPTPATGTLLRSAFTSVCTSSIGNST